jgi:hypothetical protein
VSASILGPSGHAMVELGGERAWLVRNLGEFVCSFQWIDRGDIDPEGPHPCMCIFRATRALDVVPYVIPQRNAFAFADKDGGPTPHALGAAFKAAITMGTFPANDTVRKLVDIIVEGIPDLIKMPSDQPRDLEVARRIHGIEAHAAINGKTLIQEVL